ncbi:MAG: acyltransferase [Taibaiella sp.]|nr:acyltransferase [Taibaiella sp.]
MGLPGSEPVLRKIDKTTKKIKSLDGLRALSILLVLFDHGKASMPEYITSTFFYEVLSNSQLGVRIFFIISGYLITRLLLEEKQKHGEINLKAFYKKRVLRIFPVFYLYILVIILFQLVLKDVFYWKDILIAALFLWNFKLLITGERSGEMVDDGFRNPNKDGWFLLGHFWTLAMEEQFYLMWPFVMKKVKTKKNLIKVCIAVIIIMPLLRVLVYYTVPTVRGQIDNMIFTSCDSLLLGCLMAILEKTSYKDRMIRILADTRVTICSAAFIFVASPYLILAYKGAYNLTIGMTLMNIGIASLIMFSIHRNNFWSQLLNLKTVATVGVLSYSIYIWQQLFLFTNVQWMNVTIAGHKFYLNQFPQNFILVALVSCASYYLYEKQFLKLKNRIK